MEKIESEWIGARFVRSARFAQIITVPKTWWQKLLFWRIFNKKSARFSMAAKKANTHTYQTVYPKVKIYHQKNKLAEVSTNKDFKRECKYVGKLPSKNGVTLQVGEKYWYVVQEEDIESCI